MLVALESMLEIAAHRRGCRLARLAVLHLLLQPFQSGSRRGHPDLVALQGLPGGVRFHPGGPHHHREGQSLADQGHQDDDVGAEQQQIPVGKWQTVRGQQRQAEDGGQS